MCYLPSLTLTVIERLFLGSGRTHTSSPLRTKSEPPEINKQYYWKLIPPPTALFFRVAVVPRFYFFLHYAGKCGKRPSTTTDCATAPDGTLMTDRNAKDIDRRPFIDSVPRETRAERKTQKELILRSAQLVIKKRLAACRETTTYYYCVAVVA